MLGFKHEGEGWKPGDKAGDYKDITDPSQAPERFKDDPRFTDLAKDPAHANKTDPKTIQEAMAGLEAEAKGKIPGPIERGPKEIEFYDGNGSPWDVKTPPSAPEGARWSPDIVRDAGSIIKELGKFFPNKNTGVMESMRVLWDATYMNKSHYEAVWKILVENLTAEQLARIEIININL